MNVDEGKTYDRSERRSFLQPREVMTDKQIFNFKQSLNSKAEDYCKKLFELKNLLIDADGIEDTGTAVNIIDRYILQVEESLIVALSAVVVKEDLLKQL